MPCLIIRRILSSFRPLMQMGTADAILDLVSSGTTLRENNLKEISGGSVLRSQVYIYIYRPVSLKACFVYLVAFFSSQF